MRRFGDPIVKTQSYTRRPGVYAILPAGGRLLLTRQTVPSPEFQLPGGGIDPGESPLVALHREVLEETGWRIAPLRRLGVYKRFTFMPEYDLWAEKICHLYLARPVRQLHDPTEPHHDAVWTEARAAARLLASEGDAAMTAAYLSGRLPR